MAIVNGFDTKVLQSRLASSTRYEVYYAYNSYYISNGCILVQCGYDVIENIKDYLGMIVPEENHGWCYDIRHGWDESPIENLDRYLSICGADWNFSISAQEREVVANNVIKYGSKKQLAVEYLLTNGEKVLINKAYYDIMAPAKKWGWRPKGRGALNALHFRNQANEFEMWILPIRRNKKEVA